MCRTRFAGHRDESLHGLDLVGIADNHVVGCAGFCRDPHEGSRICVRHTDNVVANAVDGVNDVGGVVRIFFNGVSSPARAAVQSDPASGCCPIGRGGEIDRRPGEIEHLRARQGWILVNDVLGVGNIDVGLGGVFALEADRLINRLCANVVAYVPDVQQRAAAPLGSMVSGISVFKIFTISVSSLVSMRTPVKGDSGPVASWPPPLRVHPSLIRS